MCDSFLTAAKLLAKVSEKDYLAVQMLLLSVWGLRPSATPAALRDGIPQHRKHFPSECVQATV